MALLLWLFDHVPLGRFAPWVFGLIVGAKPERVEIVAGDEFLEALWIGRMEDFH